MRRASPGSPGAGYLTCPAHARKLQKRPSPAHLSVWETQAGCCKEATPAHLICLGLREAVVIQQLWALPAVHCRLLCLRQHALESGASTLLALPSKVPSTCFKPHTTPSTSSNSYSGRSKERVHADMELNAYLPVWRDHHKRARLLRQALRKRLEVLYHPLVPWVSQQRQRTCTPHMPSEEKCSVGTQWRATPEGTNSTHSAPPPCSRK